MSERLNVLVIGAGMFVCGRDMGGYGTVLPALAQAQHRGEVGEIHVAATRPESIAVLKQQVVDLNTRLGINCELSGYPSTEADKDAFKKALKKIPRPACAIVVVPDHLHGPIGEEVIRAGLHLLVVKPLTPTVAEGQALISIAEESGIYGAVEFHKRFDEANLLLRQVIRDGRLGDLCYVTVEYSQRRSVPEYAFSAWADRTHIFQYLGIHYVDLIYFLTNARPVRAMATAQYHHLRKKGIETPDAVQAMVEWEVPGGGKFVASFLTHWVDQETTTAMSDQKIALVGTKGRFESNQKHRGAQLVTESGVEDINPYFTQIYAGGDGAMGVHGYGPRSIGRFLEDVRDLNAGRVVSADLEKTRPTFSQALVSTSVLEAVTKSLASQGRWVDVPGIS
jgi:predicted dehydrogenase